MQCDNPKKKRDKQESAKTISQSVMLELHGRKIFSIKVQKLKKGPLRGTPHNLSKVSLEVRGSEITSKYTATGKTIPKSDQARSNQSRKRYFNSLYDRKLNQLKDLIRLGYIPVKS